MKLYNKINEVLEKKGKTQRELSIFLGLNESSVSRWCKNKSQPTIKNLFYVAEFLGVSSHSLLHKKCMSDAEIKTPVQT